jgi:hypothetical protein
MFVDWRIGSPMTLFDKQLVGMQRLLSRHRACGVTPCCNAP